MARLNVEKKPYGGPGMVTLKVTGFGDGELSELKSMEHREAEDKLIDLLDLRNDGLGTQYACGYGIYGMWFDEEAAYMNVGTSCD